MDPRRHQPARQRCAGGRPRSEAGPTTHREPPFHFDRDHRGPHRGRADRHGSPDRRRQPGDRPARSGRPASPRLRDAGAARFPARDGPRRRAAAAPARRGQAALRRRDCDRDLGRGGSGAFNGRPGGIVTLALGTARDMGPLPVSEQDFRSLTGLIYAEAGIRLGPTKKALLTGRLSRRLRELGLDSFGAYHRYLESHPEERVPLLDCITTNETQFFREPRQFEALERSILPRWREAAEAGRRPRRVRAWSAGCSSGEEPYSLAMTLLAQFPAEAGWELEIIATDVSTRVLRRAQDGIFSLERAAQIPTPYLKRFMLKGVRGQEGVMRASDELRRIVRFERLNLSEDAYALAGSFDLIMCRNVLIYFDQASKAHVLERLLARLGPEGHLFLGHAETLGPPRLPMRSVLPNVYARDDAARR